jgi:hypothetical protein
MALLGKAAMLLSFDVVPEAIAEHDDWHTHEHLPERLSIPGFLRGSRWVARQGRPKYFVMYEVEALATLTSAAYLERLNNPTPWTAKMMTHYRGMTRGFCTVTGVFGAGLGQAGLLIHFKPAAGRDAELRNWLLSQELPDLPGKAGLASAHLFEAAVTPPATREQRIRGNDATVDWALLVTGYSPQSVAAAAESGLHEGTFLRHGAAAFSSGLYRMEYSLLVPELSKSGAILDPAAGEIAPLSSGQFQAKS